MNVKQKLAPFSIGEIWWHCQIQPAFLMWCKRWPWFTPDRDTNAWAHEVPPTKETTKYQSSHALLHCIRRHMISLHVYLHPAVPRTTLCIEKDVGMGMVLLVLSLYNLSCLHTTIIRMSSGVTVCPRQSLRIHSIQGFIGFLSNDHFRRFHM